MKAIKLNNLSKLFAWSNKCYFLNKSTIFTDNYHINSSIKKSFGFVSDKKADKSKSTKLPISTNLNMNTINPELTKQLKSITNINKLIMLMKEKPANFLQEEHVFQLFINKFRELEEKEINSNIKVYAFLDLILFTPINLSVNQVKSLIGLYLSRKIDNYHYWDYLYQALEFNNLFNNIKNDYNNNDNKETFIEILKAFSLVNYNNELLWKEFEEITFLLYKKLSIEDIESTILCFINRKQGSEELLTELIEFSKEKSEKEDIIINYTLAISNNFRNYDIYHKFIKYSFESISDKLLHIDESNITLQTADNIDLIYSLLPGYYKLLYQDKSYKMTSRYDKSRLKKFVHSIEKILATFISLKIHKFQQEDFTSIAELIKISMDIGFKFKHLRSKYLLKFFLEVFNNKNNYSYTTMLSYLVFFMRKQVRKKNLQLEVLSKNDVWEKFIDDIHLMSLNELMNLTKVLHYYSVEYMRLWLFLQTILKRNLQVKYNYSLNTEESLTKINETKNSVNVELLNKDVADSNEVLVSKLERLVELANMLKEGNYYLNDEVIPEFIFFLDKEIQNVNVILSWRIDLDNNVSSKQDFQESINKIL